MTLVTKCSQYVYDAARALQQDIDDNIKIERARLAFAANKAAADSIGPTVRDLRRLMARLGREAGGDTIRLPKFVEMLAPVSHNAQSGSKEGVKQAVTQDMHKVAPEQDKVKESCVGKEGC